jgi:predicted MFS family arabinose efflux permease
MGLISAGHSVGGAVGAYLGGYLFDVYARYDWVWMTSIGLAVFAGLLTFLLHDRAEINPTPGPLASQT